ncbi:MAG: sulfotransferase, partial [Candidatus Bipolaricaulia bacterium]
MTQRYRLIYILGSGHCGSTLLDLLLNGHSQILGLGEIKSIGKYTASAEESGDNWVHTPFWQKVKGCYEKTSQASFAQIDISNPKWSIARSWDAEDIETWTRPNDLLLSCIHRVSGAKMLTDASKFPHRLYLLQRAGLFDIRVIHLVRDGRAVMNSYIRKYGDFGTALRRWASPALLAFSLRRNFTKTDWLRIRYEELATRPKDTLKRVCAFLEVGFEPKMLAFRGHPYFGIGGNRMRYRGDAHIFLDERWKGELKLRHQLAFSLIAGWLN